MVLSLHQIMTFLRNFLSNLRLDFLFISSSCAMAGMAYGNQTSRLLFLLALIPFFFCYGFGKTLTDELSRFSKRKTVIKTNVIGLFLCAVWIALVNPWNILFIILSLLAIGGYVALRKKGYLSSPMYLGFVIVFLPIMGLLGMGGQMGDLIKSQMLWLYVFTLCSFANLVLMCQLKAIQTDQSLGIKTIPAILGWNGVVLLGDLFVVLSVVAAGMTINYADNLALVVFVAGSVVAIAGQVKAHLTKKRGQSIDQFIIHSTIRSFVLWHLAVFVGERSDFNYFSIAFYILFEASLQLKGATSEKK